jgi:hypothetical protein
VDFEPPELYPAAGRWRGSSARGVAVEFLVVPEGLARMGITWDLAGCSWDLDLTFDEPARITDSTVSLNADLGDGGTTDIELKFVSRLEARGTVSFELIGPPGGADCRGSGVAGFTASRVAD